MLSALCDAPEIFSDCDVIWFVDNEAACSTLVRGASRESDVNDIAELTHLHSLKLRCRIWYEWIDSKSNPSDGLSRQGLDCPLFGTRAAEATEPQWGRHTARLRPIGPLAALVSGRAFVFARKLTLRP